MHIGGRPCSEGSQGLPSGVQLTACKVDDIEAFAKDMLAKGHCVVIGLQSTGAPPRLSTPCWCPPLPPRAPPLAPCLHDTGTPAQPLCQRLCRLGLWKVAHTHQAVLQQAC